MANIRTSHVSDARLSLRPADNGRVEEDVSVKIIETELLAGW